MDEALTNAINRLAERLGGGGRERHMVDFPIFKGGHQDPIEWLDNFEKACLANGVTTGARKLQIASAYLKEEVASWFQTLSGGDIFWKEEEDDKYSANLYFFRELFENKYNTTFKRT